MLPDKVQGLTIGPCDHRDGAPVGTSFSNYGDALLLIGISTSSPAPVLDQVTLASMTANVCGVDLHFAAQLTPSELAHHLNFALFMREDECGFVVAIDVMRQEDA
jgi:hypothetical protein